MEQHPKGHGRSIQLCGKLTGYPLHEEHLSAHLKQPETRLTLLPKTSQTQTDPSRCGYKVIPLTGIVALWVVKAERSVWDLHAFLQLVLQMHPNKS